MPTSSTELKLRTDCLHSMWVKKVGSLVDIKSGPGDATRYKEPRAAKPHSAPTVAAPNTFGSLVGYHWVAYHTSAPPPVRTSSRTSSCAPRRGMLCFPHTCDPQPLFIHFAKLPLCFRFPLRLSARLQQTPRSFGPRLGASNCAGEERQRD